MKTLTLTFAEWMEQNLDCYDALSPAEAEERFCDMLDESGDIVIGCLRFSPSAVLREMDETAYRCGLSDYIDAEGFGEYCVGGIDYYLPYSVEDDYNEYLESLDEENEEDEDENA